MNNYKLTLLAILITSSVTAQAELTSTNTVCPAGSTNCNITEIGDKDLSADNSVSESTQNNPSSNTNVSGTTINPDNKDVNNNSNDGSITGGNTSSHGGSATGNKSDNRNDTNSNASNGNQSLDASNSFNAGTTSNNLGQGQSQSSRNDLANSNKTSNDVSNAMGQGQSSNNSNKVSGSTQGQSSNNDVSSSNKASNDNKVSSKNANDVSNKLGQSSNNSNKVEGSKQGQSSFNDLSTSDNRKQSSNTTSNSGSNSGSNSSNKLGNSGNSNTRVDASDRSVSNYTSQALSRAPIIHGGVISLPSPTMNTVVGECSPIPSVATQSVYGTHIGVFKNKSVPLGFTQQLGANYNSAPFNYFTAPDGAIYEMGVKSVITTSVNNMGSSRSVSANLSRALGEDVGGGAANSSSMQGQVTTVQLVPCVHAVYEPKAPNLQEDTVQNLEYLEHGQKG